MFSCILKGLTWGTFTQLCAPINSKKLLNSKVFVCWVREKTCFCWKMANWKASFYLDGERQLARSDQSCRIRITQHYAVGTHPCKGYQVLVLVLGTNLTVTVSLPSNYETFISSFWVPTSSFLKHWLLFSSFCTASRLLLVLYTAT